MSIASEISRLNTAKADIKAVLEGKGIPVSSTLKIDGYAELIESFVLDIRVVAKFDVTDTSSPTQIIGNYVISPFSAIEIDGVVQPSVVNTYPFSTLGEHTVKYTLTDPTSIGNSAFMRCIGLTTLTIPNSVTSIGGSAFRGCSGLTSVTIPNSVASIGNSAFNGCSGLTSVTIPNSVTSIGDRAFNGCSGLTSVTIPNSVTSIGDSAFRGCSGLTSVTIPNSVTSIGEYAFCSCYGLTSITIPNSVTSIGEYAFDECTNLTSISIGNSVTSIGDSVFHNCRNLTSIISNATTAPTVANSAFIGISSSGTLTVPQGSSGYDTWMGYLSNWTKVEQ